MFSIILKQIKCEISPCLTILLNQCMATGIFPEKLKIAKNYTKGVIHNQVCNYLNTHDIITNRQYSFRRRHSTELTAIELIDRTTSELDHYKIPFNIYIDMSKAFDLIDFTVLRHKLSHYGIHHTAWKLLKSYLTDRN